MMHWGAAGLEGKAYSSVTVKRLAGYLHRDVPQLILAGVMVVFSAALMLAGPYLIKIAIDDGISQNRVDVLTIATILYPATLVGVWLLTYGQTRLVSGIGQRLLGKLRLDMFVHLQRLPTGFFTKRQVGSLMSRVINDISILNEFISVGALQILADVLLLIAIAIVMLVLDPGLALMIFLTFPVTFIAARIYAVKAHHAFRQSRQAVAEVNASLQENIAGVRVAQSFAREDRNIAQFGKINDRNFNAAMRAGVLAASLTPAVEILRAVCMVLIVVYGGWRAIDGVTTVGVLVAFLTYVNRFFEPIRQLSQWFNMLQASMVAGERVFELLDEPVTVIDTPDAIEADSLQGRVEFADVSFEYEANRPVLEQISFTIEPGQTVALVGPTGAGKTTIASLLSRFYDAGAGQVKVDGRDVREYQQRSLRRQMAVVLQEPFLFSGTVEDNLLFGRPSATSGEVGAAAAAVGADQFIAHLDKQYETEVDERGVRLSLGQRQLVAFARALLADPKILILDEATANIDVQSELRLQEAIATLLKGRTALVIAHRLSTIRRADLILVLDQGRIVQRGRHDDLIVEPGLYQQLYSLQAQVA